MCNNPGLVYDTAKNNDVNALLVVVRAIIEGNSPGASRNNYWGIGCVNGVTNSNNIDNKNKNIKISNSENNSIVSNNIVNRSFSEYRVYINECVNIYVTWY